MNLNEKGTNSKILNLKYCATLAENEHFYWLKKNKTIKLIKLVKQTCNGQVICTTFIPILWKSSEGSAEFCAC